MDEAEQAVPVEIKAGSTIHPEFLKNLRYWLKLSGNKYGRVIYAGNVSQKRSEGIEIISWRELNKNLIKSD